LNLDGGEILLESFYLNLRQDPLRLRPHGTYDPQSRRLLSLSIQFDAPTWGEGVATANLENLGGRLGEVKFSLGPITNERALAIFVKEPFGQVSPMVRGLSVSGETFITGEIRGSASGYSLRGLVETSAVDLVVPRFGVEAKALKIRFPFAIDHAGGDMIAWREDPDDSLDGFITGDWIRWRSQEWRDVTVSMMLKDDVLFFPHEMKLPILGGAVILEAGRIRNPFEGKRRITLGLRLERLDFSKVTNLFLPFALPGRVEGYFSEISVSQATLETRGKLTVHALGGEIEVHNINGMTPFTRLRKVSMDVLFEDIDLEEASRSFEFGQMGGIIQGEIRGLSFSFGQPESFELGIRSVKRRGVKQYVNAEAVNNLSILSTGSGFSFKKGALQFLKYFPYAKLGIYCKLENDVFTLRGTIHRRGVEYLIRRGLVGGIDVVNQNPDNRIRWRQMLRRLRAIRQGVGGVEVSTGK